MKSIFAVALLVLGSACATHPPLHYALVTPTQVTVFDARTNIDKLRELRAGTSNDLLWFERNGAEYIVSDAATIERAARLIGYVQRDIAQLGRYAGSQQPSSGYYYGGDPNKGVPPYEPAVPKVESSSGGNLNAQAQTESWHARNDQPQYNQSGTYMSVARNENEWLQTLQIALQRSKGDLGRLLDDAVASGTAQKFGAATPAQSQ